MVAVLIKHDYIKFCLHRFLGVLSEQLNNNSKCNTKDSYLDYVNLAGFIHQITNTL